MSRLLAVVVAALVLAGCTTFRDLDAGLNGLIGQTQDQAFQQLGYPSGEERLAGKKVYVWRVDQRGAIPIYTPNTTTGYVGTTPFSATTSTMQMVPIQNICTVRLFVNEQTSRVEAYDWSGNQSGCQNFARRVKPRR